MAVIGTRMEESARGTATESSALHSPLQHRFAIRKQIEMRLIERQ